MVTTVMDDDMYIPIPGLVCPECSAVVYSDYSRSYLREKAFVDGEVEVIHCGPADEQDKTTVDTHMNTVKLSTAQLDTIRNLLSKG
jgi:hypothetical protein